MCALTRDEIRSAMRRGADTLDIARVVGVREPDVWNALARSDDAVPAMRQPQVPA